MSTIDRILNALRRVPRGFSADGRRLGLGLAAALDAQRAHADRADVPTGGDRRGPALPSRDDAASAVR